MKWSTKTKPPEEHLVWWIFTKEIRDLLRDRRAVFFAFIVPLFLYPLLFVIVHALPWLEREKLAERELAVGFSGSYKTFLPYVESAHILVREESDLDALRKGRLALLVHFEAGVKVNVTLSHLATSPASAEARRRLERALEEYRNDLLKERFSEKALSISPRELVSLESVDLATIEERSGANLGRLLPLLCVVLLLTGGSFAALDLVAGEKERGTLETLYVHPVPVDCVVWGKFLVILFASLLSAFLNLAGVLIALALGSGFGLALPGMDNSVLLLPRFSTLLVAFLLLVPQAALTSAVLLSLSSYARSFREAQTYLLPLTLVALVGVLPALSPGVKLESVVAVVPLANVALALREALEGSLRWLPCAAVLATTSLYAALALRQAAGLLAREDVILRLEAPPLALEVTGEGRARRALFFGGLMLLLVYFGGTALQVRAFYWGIAITLWVVVLVPALAYPVFFKLPWRALLGFRISPVRNLFLAVPLAAASLVLLAAYLLVQDSFLPLPEKMEEAFREFLGREKLSTSAQLFLLAISPGICEELLWRGAVQGELEVRGKPVKTAITVGIFFGLFHLSIYRFIPTGLLGILLAIVRHRGGSIFPCMLLHIAYNALLLFFLKPAFANEELAGLLTHPLSLGLAAVVLVACLLGLRPPPQNT